MTCKLAAVSPVCVPSFSSLLEPTVQPSGLVRSAAAVVIDDDLDLEPSG